jgi:beta-ribofuranosylaminobenzene 5'-phosphate synthase
MVGSPGFVLRASRADHDEVLGEPHWRDRLLNFVDHYRRIVPSERQPPPLHWEIEHALPPHAGLGSGTQLGLAAAKALSVFAGEREVPGPELARRAGRGLRSAVGLYGFSQGGLLIEGGKRSPEEISPLVARAIVPPAWRFVLMRPRDAVGLSGAEERQGFAQLGPMPTTTTDRLCRLALLEIVPSVIEADFEHCAVALDEFGQVVGEYFAPIQGGVYANPQMRALADRLHARGIRGLCQSSWGPTLFVLSPHANAAQSLVNELSSDPENENVELTISEPFNRGATVEVGE